jgi:hypothetical protein
MKTELQLVNEFKELFEKDYQIASNILIAGKPSDVNINFFSRQKEWCQTYFDKFSKIHEDLKNEKLPDRILRCLGDDENVYRLTKAIETLKKHKDDVIKKKEEAERKRKEEEEKKRLELEKKEKELAAELEVE